MADSESIIDLGDGFRIRRRGRTYHIGFSVAGVRHRHGLRTRVRDEAIAKGSEMRDLFLATPAGFARKLLDRTVCAPWSYTEGWGQKVLRHAGERAKLKSREFTIGIEDIRRLAEQSGGACALTRLPFIVERDPRYRANPFTPSLDRIDSHAGYTPGNVRLVCLCVNMALGNWGEGVFSMMAKGYVKALMDHPAVSPELLPREVPLASAA
jgi:hypothetical protein